MCCSVVRGKAAKNLVKFKGQIIADLTTVNQVTSKGSGWKTSWKGMVKAWWAQVTKVSRHFKLNDKWDEKVQDYKMWPSKAYGWNHSSSHKMIKQDKMFHKAATIWKKILTREGKWREKSYYDIPLQIAWQPRLKFHYPWSGSCFNGGIFANTR